MLSNCTLFLSRAIQRAKVLLFSHSTKYFWKKSKKNKKHSMVAVAFGLVVPTLKYD